MDESLTEEFLAFFPEIVKVLTTQDTVHPEPPKAIEWFRKVLKYTVPHGKKIRGESVVSTYRHLVGKPTEEDIKIAKVLGWCVELAYFLVTDDIMDKSETRRGYPCWYKKEEVQMIAINDALLLEGGIYQLLKKFIRDKPYYRDVMELFLQSGYQTAIGQTLDLTTAPPEAKPDFKDFTEPRHASIVQWKTSFYTLYLPVALAFYMAGITDTQTHMNAKKILLKIGHYYQVQDDYLDVYGDPKVIGKIGTDIQDNKCSWLIVNSLALANKTQKQILMDNYGRWDEECVQRVKKIYGELDIPNLYHKYEKNCNEELVVQISELSGSLPKQIFLDFTSRLHNRSK